MRCADARCGADFRAAGTLLWLALCLVLATPARPAAAQELALKRAIPVAPACPRPSPTIPPTLAEREEARQFITAGEQAALLGDQTGARNQFQRAARLDPLNADLAYRLARTHEELGEPREAVREYCRYLALAPEAADAGELRERIGEIAPATEEVQERAAEAFRTGLTAYDEERFREAQLAFTQALRAEPRWADAYYNRALTLLRQEQPRRAANDLQSYLRFAPRAEDRPEVEARLASLASSPPLSSPSGALARGMVIPGLGQFYTRRPALGALVLAGAGATAYLAMQPREGTRRMERLDPNGQPVVWTEPVTEYPYLASGIAGAAAITALGALEAYIYARRLQRERDGAATASPEDRSAFSLSIPRLIPSRQGILLHFQLHLPRR
ncbi:MAG TPA: tetratricopeptide repeat protein [Longimicrobiaceae bacterium]|nr:tetratricopeptide repeat protein [Longimicrobiaceae bacterium]